MADLSAIDSINYGWELIQIIMWKSHSKPSKSRPYMFFDKSKYEKDNQLFPDTNILINKKWKSLYEKAAIINFIATQS